MSSILTEIESSYCSAFKLPFIGEVYDWAGENVDLQQGYAIKGKFNVHRSKYLVKPFQALRDRKKRVVVIAKAPRTGGSLVADLWVPYIIENDPGEMLWLFQDDDIAKKYAETRFNPLVKSIVCLREKFAGLGIHDKQKTTILFPTMSLIIGGLNEGNVQTLGKQYVIISEGWMAGRNGLIGQGKSRCGDYPYTSKILIEGQQGEEDDDFDIEWKDSDQQRYGWQCPSCKKLQPHDWNVQRPDGSYAGVIWETNEFTKPGGKWVEENGKRHYIGGKWNYPAVQLTARFSCLYCGHNVDDTPTNRRLLNDTGDYIVTNPDAEPTVSGFHWPAQANVDIALGGLVSKYLKAKVQADERGNFVPLQQFYQKDQAKAWNPNLTTTIRVIDCEPYEINTDWPGEKYRAMTIDCQRDFSEFWYVIAAWGLGEVRELARGKANSWAELEELQKLWKVKDQLVFVDVGYEQDTVCGQLVKHGHEGKISGQSIWLCWTALKGMEKASLWTHKVAVKKGNKVEYEYEKRAHSERIQYNFGLGKNKEFQRTHTRRICPLYEWSNLHIKNTLVRWRDGKAGKFLVGKCEDRLARDPFSFTSQMNSEVRRNEQDKKNGKKKSVFKQIGDRPNHWWDCWSMQFAVANIKGVIEQIEEEENETDEKKLAA
jgi:hypothetical protein